MEGVRYNGWFADHACVDEGRAMPVRPAGCLVSQCLKMVGQYLLPVLACVSPLWFNGVVKGKKTRG